MNVLLNVSTLTKSFGTLTVLEDLSFPFLKGNSYAIVGENGCGKSTFLNVIAGNVKCDKGLIKFRNEDLNKLSRSQRVKRGVLHLPQKNKFFSRLSVREHLEMSQRFGIRDNIDAWQNSVSNIFSLQDSDTFFSSLSFGQKRLLALESALNYEPQLLLLDEPSQGISKKMKIKMISLLNEVQSKVSTTIIFTTHDMSLLSVIPSTVLTLENGKFHGA